VPVWAINGRFLTQRMTGVQRYAREIVAALDEILTQEADRTSLPAMRLIVPPAVRKSPALSKIAVCRTRAGVIGTTVRARLNGRRAIVD